MADKIDPKRYAEFESEILRLKSEIQEMKVSHDLENTFYEFGGKRSKEDDLITYFEIVRGYALKFIKRDERGKILFVDFNDGLPLKTPSGKAFSMKDLMSKIKSHQTLGNYFDSKNTQNTAAYSTRESLREIKDPAARLARARELGLTGKRGGV